MERVKRGSNSFIKVNTTKDTNKMPKYMVLGKWVKVCSSSYFVSKIDALILPSLVFLSVNFKSI